MKRLSFRLVVALTTFLIGVALVASWFFRRRPAQPLEEPPCRSCAEIYSSASPILENVPLPAIVRDPSRFNNRIVRVQSALHNDVGHLTLFDPNNTKTEYFFAEFSDRSSYKACGGMKQVLHDVAGIDNWFDSSAGVAVVGRVRMFNPIGGPSDWRYGFEIMCVERAYPLSEKNP